jgi:hypothetical protein
MKQLVFLLVLLGSSWVEAQQKEYIYYGPWHTTNRKLNGDMTAVVKSTGKDQWEGRFYGVWQGVKYDYTVKFVGKADTLTGQAKIDGADYDWKGEIDTEKFKATFTGSRYNGYFDMKRK